MRLKTLEIKGFKSFADKTVLNFDERITGVVGPNGCGKSNIVDSIRWVIGEHKISNLRSENLEGLVFNGSRNRSASGLAEVSLTFENNRKVLPTEFTTVTITRKFFKNGDSEYRLNDVACRLKDIHNLFLDTGVSTDSYAIIELGMVDDIIKDKDNSRRKMLEQAAGISIYKTRKKEAKLKLDATEGDLNRIEDLLFEINNNLKTLESQARKAERYYNLKAEYKKVSVELAKASLEGFNLSFKELTAQQEQENDKKFQLEANISKQEAELEKNKLLFVNKEKELQQLQQQFNELVSNIRTCENDKNLASQRLSYLKERKVSLSEFLDKSGSQLSDLQQSISFTDKQLSEEKERLQDMQDELEGYQDMLEEKKEQFQEKKSVLDKLRQERQELQRRQFEIEKKTAVADTSLQNYTSAITQAKEDKTQREEQVEGVEQEKAELESNIARQQDELQRLTEKQERTKEQILHSQDELEKLREQLVEENRKLDARKNEYDLLKSLVDNLEGYPESIKFLKKNKNWQSQAPILSDVFFCKEDYRTAIENLLEPYLNYYVVNNVPEAMEGIRLLEQNKKGKANFFILDQLKDNKQSVKAPQGTIPALELVELDSKYEALGHYLLADVFVADDWDLVDFEQLNGQDIIVLDKSGKIRRGQFTLSGGSVGLFEGKKLGRAKNLEKLASEIEALEKAVSERRAMIKEKHEEVLSFNDELKQNPLNEGKEQLNKLQNQLFGLQNKIENYRHLIVTADKRIAEIQAKYAEEEKGISAVRAEQDELAEQSDKLDNGLAQAEMASQEVEQSYNQANVQFNSHNLQFTKQQSKVQGQAQELSFKKKQLSDLEQQISGSNVQLKEVAESIEESDQKKEAAEKQLEELLKRRETDEKKLNEKDQAYYNFRNEVNEQESSLRQLQKNKDQVEQLLISIKDKVNELKLHLTSMKERLSVEFKVNLDDILDEERENELPVEELEAEAEKMKKRFENMGEVNPTAIEAFQEMKKRYDFILEQKNDLVSAKESLLTTIQEVETTANQKFLETFNEVKENFSKVFKALFTEEDECDMVLSDPDNLAETGIDIMAKPKGKRPSTIGQLSGGEKTLTATALLFAIYLIKPAPFCILDEVDAPLDDANVGKFTQMIRKFSEKSQFIIVTHNKQTMASVDVIYGVTMQEAGVSKLVPVDFRSLN